MLTMLPVDELLLAYGDHLREPSPFVGDEFWLPMDELLRVRLLIMKDLSLRKFFFSMSVDPSSSIGVGWGKGSSLPDDESCLTIDAIRQRVIELEKDIYLASCIVHGQARSISIDVCGHFRGHQRGKDTVLTRPERRSSVIISY